MCMTAHFNSLSDAVRADVLEGRIETAHRPGLYRNGGKRVLDILLVIAASPVILMLTAILALPMLLRGESPFYSQRRVGLGGRTFVMWKLRSMVVDADDRLSRYLRDNPEAREEWARHQKLRDDPRITSYGRFLRKLSLDELPQLWNVVLGDMSLIGPRPMMPHQRALYHGVSYYALRPGVSGFWQVSERNDAEFVSRVKFDDKYDREVSLATDLVLILRTLRTMARGTGL
jgi:exopolysaccharide production protein ExoY